MCACAHACERACMHACVCVCAHASMRVGVRRCLNVACACGSQAVLGGMDGHLHYIPSLPPLPDPQRCKTRGVPNQRKGEALLTNRHRIAALPDHAADNTINSTVNMPDRIKLSAGQEALWLCSSGTDAAHPIQCQVKCHAIQVFERRKIKSSTQ